MHVQPKSSLRPWLQRTALAALLGVACCLPAHAEFAAAGGAVSLLDGDTIVVGREHIRLLSIDTPETFRSRCDNELVLGLKAKERLRQLLDSGPVTIDRHGLDRYRRKLANVHAGDVDVSQVLLDEGYAVAYRPGRAAWLERARKWCGPNWNEN